MFENDRDQLTGKQQREVRSRVDRQLALGQGKRRWGLVPGADVQRGVALLKIEAHQSIGPQREVSHRVGHAQTTGRQVVAVPIAGQGHEDLLQGPALAVVMEDLTGGDIGVRRHQSVVADPTRIGIADQAGRQGHRTRIPFGFHRGQAHDLTLGRGLRVDLRRLRRHPLLLGRAAQVD